MPTGPTRHADYGIISELTKVQVKPLLKKCSSKRRRFAVKARSKTAKFYAANPEAAENRREYQREYNKTEERKKYRAYLTKKNRDAGTYGNGDNMDYDHDERRMISARRNRSKK